MLHIIIQLGMEYIHDGFFTNNKCSYYLKVIHESVHINITSFVLRLRVPADNLLFNYWTPQKTDLVSFQKC